METIYPNLLNRCRSSTNTLSLLIEFLVPIQQSEQSCNLCVKDIDFTFSFDFISFFFRRGILGKDVLHWRGSLKNFVTKCWQSSEIISIDVQKMLN
jgi:hypothetical protein